MNRLYQANPAGLAVALLLLVFAATTIYQSTQGIGLKNNAENYCLAKAAYFEAGNRGIPGMVAVAHVVHNRAIKVGRSHCETIHMPGQFPWSRGGLEKPDFSSEAWSKSYKAVAIMKAANYDITDGSMWFHANYVSPAWAMCLQRVGFIDGHWFYKERQQKKKGCIVAVP